MKEVEILSAILLILTGAMVVESGYGFISIILGFVLLGAGAFLYLFAVDTLEETSPRQDKKKGSTSSPGISLGIFFLFLFSV